MGGGNRRFIGRSRSINSGGARNGNQSFNRDWLCRHRRSPGSTKAQLDCRWNLTCTQLRQFWPVQPESSRGRRRACATPIVPTWVVRPRQRVRAKALRPCIGAHGLRQLLVQWGQDPALHGRAGGRPVRPRGSAQVRRLWRCFSQGRTRQL